MIKIGMQNLVIKKKVIIMKNETKRRETRSEMSEELAAPGFHTVMMERESSRNKR